MTPKEIAEVRPRLLDFAAEMLGGLPRKDQRAKGELYVRGLLTDGQRKSMQPMAARLGVDHQWLQQFITSSTWDYAAVRRNVARWFAASQPVGALVIDDTGFAKDGTASPCVARQYSGTLGKVANCQEITAAGGARPVVVTDAGYGDNTTFRLELDARGWRYAVAVKGTTSAYAGDARR